ncbi:alpha/beta fold hydrolase [Staphylococcus massiliensis]|uniref:Esterase or lipase n=1 Tax=Staphylococcus massiliensis S46 TaxID=1229783 RepID=K9ATT3_9STAP|nr:alpha/beta hydrolase [Staphylococcus massiliensis]EKU46012.1 esterase or lipase [Staphylococcus massiliensis S46]MCG3400280.1 alpha/beta hydrolase [Staphylococcus massiliensis]MCG3401910.1 alpha/beta hydrolase [Staphylococcus massiliensis]MCG3412428.1 alpha/beta hydrolase [Staphylococcus massiliensis]PNZ97999.1 alpha/beta hydrolase [Staphylococcus massiliensis CCUG 55927]
MNKMTTSDQHSIAFESTGKGIPLIMIHDLGGNMAAMNDTKQQLSKYFQVITYDVRGHGKSSKPRDYDFQDHVRDLKELMDQLDIKTAHIIGHDMGGLIGLEFANQYSNQVITLTLISSKINEQVESFCKLISQHREEIAGFSKLEAKIILFPYIYKNLEKTKTWYQEQKIYFQQREDDNAIAMRALLNYKPNFEALSTVPIFMINGRHDPYIGDHNFDNLKTLLPNARCQTFELSGHAPHIEEQDNFINVYKNFTSILA